MDINDYLSNNRFKSIFQPQSPPGVSFTPDMNTTNAPQMDQGQTMTNELPSNEAPPSTQIQGKMASILQSLKPDTTLGDLYKAALGTPPVRTEPSTMRKVGGVLAGLGNMGPATYSHGAALGINSNPEQGMQIANDFMNAPYNQQMGDYQTRLKNLESGAKDENAGNAIKRQTAYQEATTGINADKAAVADRNQTSLAKSRDARASYNEGMLKVKQLLAERPDYERNIVNGELVLTSKHDKSDIVHTGITGMTDMDKAEIGIKKANIAAEASKSNANTRAETAKNITDKKIATKPDKTKDLSPTQQLAADKQYLLDIRKEHPELADFIDPKTAAVNTPKGIMSGHPFGGQDTEKLHRIQELLNQKRVSGSKKSNTPNIDRLGLLGGK